MTKILDMYFFFQILLRSVCQVQISQQLGFLKTP
jgi:hypothetical protein